MWMSRIWKTTHFAAGALHKSAFAEVGIIMTPFFMILGGFGTTFHVGLGIVCIQTCYSARSRLLFGVLGDLGALLGHLGAQEGHYEVLV